VYKKFGLGNHVGNTKCLYIEEQYRDGSKGEEMNISVL
jgi:hypothetical protein